MRLPDLLLVPILLAAGMARAQDYLNCHFAPGWRTVRAKTPVHRRQPLRVQGWRRGRLPELRLCAHAGAHLQVGRNTLTIDVSEMSDADSAYGIFAANRDPSLPIAKIGMGGQVQPQSASFAKGKYYVEIVKRRQSGERSYAELQASSPGWSGHRGPGDAPGGAGVVP